MRARRGTRRIEQRGELGRMRFGLDRRERARDLALVTRLEEGERGELHRVLGESGDLTLRRPLRFSAAAVSKGEVARSERAAILRDARRRFAPSGSSG